MAFLQDVQTGVQIQPSANGLETFIHLSQGENGRKLYIKILGIDEIPAGSVATIFGTKPDGNVYSATGTIDDITIVFNEDVQMTVVAGIWDANIRIVNDGNMIASARIRFVIHESAVAPDGIPSDSQLEGIVAECQMYAENARTSAYGSPLTASTAADMLDTTKVYVYTGEETGYTEGHWYYWNGTAWTDGGVYNSIAIQTDKTLTLPDHAADAKTTGDTLALKANTEGEIAMAKALVGGKYTLDKSPYHYRKSPEAGSLDEKIIGGTLGWNQLITVAGKSFTNSTEDTNGTSLNLKFRKTLSPYTQLLGKTVGTGIISAILASDSDITGMSLIHSGVTRNINIYADANLSVINGNKYLFSVNIVSATVNVVGGLVTKDFQLIDLTALFGSTIADYIYSLEQSSAGAGVDWVRQYIDIDTYHEYCEPTLMSVEGLQSRDVVGKNLFDSSQMKDQTAWNLITLDVPPDTQITMSTTKPSNELYCYFNNTGVTGGSSDNAVNNAHSVTVTSTKEGHVYVSQRRASGSYSFANYDYQVELGSTATPYEPYEKHSYPLDSSVTLQGIPKLDSNNKLCFDGDIYPPSGEVARRYRLVDLGTLDWTKVTAYTDGNAYSTTITNKKNRTANSAIDVISTIPHVGQDVWLVADTPNNHMLSKGDVIYVRMDSITDAAAFKSAMSGVMLVYEKATPTTSTAQPFQSPQLAGSIEEYVTSGVVPVGHESRYYEDITGKVNDLPSDFSTLIAPAEKSFTATRNYTVGSFVIVNNQLYKVSSAISSGGTITPNSNCTATTIMAEILALA